MSTQYEYSFYHRRLCCWDCGWYEMPQCMDFPAATEVCENCGSEQISKRTGRFVFRVTRRFWGVKKRDLVEFRPKALEKSYIDTLKDCDLSPEVLAFLSNVADVCYRHGMMITVSGYDYLQVWPLEEEPFDPDIQDRTGET